MAQYAARPLQRSGAVYWLLHIVYMPSLSVRMGLQL